MASIGGSDRNSDYIEFAKKSSTIPANTPDLAGHISELEEMYKIAEGELVKLAQPTVLFARTDELKISELYNDETNPPENHQYNGATPPVNAQTSPPHSPLKDTLLASTAPLPHQHVESDNATLQAQK